MINISLRFCFFGSLSASCTDTRGEFKSNYNTASSTVQTQNALTLTVPQCCLLKGCQCWNRPTDVNVAQATTYIHAHILHTCRHAHTYTQTHTHTCMRTCIHAYAYMHTYIHTQTERQACIHTYIHSFTHTYNTHTYTKRR
jgi:hypothetical protein